MDSPEQSGFLKSLSHKIYGTLLILDIALPRKYVIGGKIVAKIFNIGTLSWFEGIRFNVSVDVGASGKGISVKDERE